MTDLNPYEEGLATDLAKAQACIDDLTRRHEHALRKIDVLEDQIEKAVEALVQIAGKKDYADDPWSIARTILAELKGQDDE